MYNAEENIFSSFFLQLKGSISVLQWSHDLFMLSY